MSERHDGSFEPGGPDDTDPTVKIIWAILKQTIASGGPIMPGVTREIETEAEVVYHGVTFQVAFTFKATPHAPQLGPTGLTDTIEIDDSDKRRMN